MTQTPFVSTEIATQPDLWRQVAGGFAQYGGALPKAGQRVAAVGCGTSWFMAMAYAALREDLGQGETDAFAGSEFPADRAYDAIVVISRSGTTTEVLELIRATFRHRGPRWPGPEVSKRRPAITMYAWPGLVKTVIHRPRPGRPHFMKPVEGSGAFSSPPPWSA